MDMLLAGVLLWSFVHYIPGLLPNLKIKLVDMLGKAYRGLIFRSITTRLPTCDVTSSRFFSLI